MTRTALTMVILTFAGLLLAQPALANNLRCGTHLLQTGARSGPGMYEVLMKCGTPTERHGNTWIYKKYGTTKIVYFNDAGQLTRVEERAGR